MDHKASILSSYREPFLVNLVAAFCLALLIALGAYVNSTTILVGGTSSPGFHAIQVDSTSWNVGCTVLGTAVGLLLSWGYSSFDGLLTRKELQSPNGVLAMYLRPLSAMRGFNQLRRRRFPVTRSFLILATAVSSLASATTVAIFGIHTERVLVNNPLASYSLDQIYRVPGDVQHPDQVSFVTVGANPALLSSFLYRDSYLRSFQADGQTDTSLSTGNYVSESGPIGDTIFPGLNSSGIGLNMTSYTQYSGPSSGFDLPTSYTFERLDAAVFGTVVDVACVDATASYNVTTTKYGDQETPDAVLYTFVKNDVINTTILQDPNFNSGLCIGSIVTEQNGEPLHTFLFPGGYYIDTPLVSECTYGGNEILASISLLEGGSPLQVNGIVTQGSPINATIKWLLSNMTDQYISRYSHGGPGGSLADGWVTSGFYVGGFDTIRTSIAPTMSTILSELGQAYYSLLRQNVEVANLDRGLDKIPDNGSFVKIAVTVLRVGGSSAAWIIIYGLLFMSALLGVVIAPVQKRVLPWSPQNPVEILQKCLPMAAIIDDLTPLKYREQFEVAYGDGAGELTQSKQTNALIDPQAQQTGYDGYN
ncbi:hypothetical protein OIDMADRAFT_59974 [Oidiodendron maius Zn]|uniref:Uncharacterized protein n=1 Tax=Oidiodendron maius (strain Zn) TaxID=913774 RepID=A0A0C3GZ38_OIDMZ|nr:hypothetical protein OIDMADRAFT_59974 [Oidiodendron maius Zn]